MYLYKDTYTITVSDGGDDSAGLDEQSDHGGCTVVNIFLSCQLHELVVDLGAGFKHSALAVGLEHGMLLDVRVQLVCRIFGGLDRCVDRTLIARCTNQ